MMQTGQIHDGDIHGMQLNNTQRVLQLPLIMFDSNQVRLDIASTSCLDHCDSLRAFRIASTQREVCSV